MDDIQKFVNKAREKELTYLEQILEESVQSGEHGVLIVRDQMGALVNATVSVTVPYGYIYEMRTDVER